MIKSLHYLPLFVVLVVDRSIHLEYYITEVVEGGSL